MNSLNNCKDSRDLFVIAAAFINFFAVILLLIKHLLPSKSGNYELVLGKVVLQIFNNFTGEHPCQSFISIKLKCDFNKVALQLY